MADPVQNHSFREHYLDVELDLSHVVLFATADLADAIPGRSLHREGRSMPVGSRSARCQKS